MKLLLLLFLVPGFAYAARCPHPVRHQAPLEAFAKAHPCPASGKPETHCPGYVIDHIRPLCDCGKDDPSNMQWMDVKTAKLKDHWERQLCAQP